MAKNGNRKGNTLGAGRKPGIPNKTTTELREAISKLVSKNIDKADKWLEQVAIDNPAKALELLIKLMDMRLPKLPAEAEDSNKREDFITKEADRLMKLSKAS